jgi:dephospho-CoA kinase
MKVFITGMAGVGKTTMSKMIAKRGYKIIDVDAVLGLCAWTHNETKERVEGANLDDVSLDFMDVHEYECDMKTLEVMISGSDQHVFVFGCVGDNTDFIPLFDRVFLLQCSPEVLITRLNNRDTNSLGKRKEMQERILAWRVVFDDLMLKAGAVSINTEQELEASIDQIFNELD